jgi:uncharacterized membrane protein
MRTWLENQWDLLRTNFLFFPLLMSAASVAVWVGISILDRYITLPETPGWGWLRAGGAEGVRSLLSALVGSLMTALSIVFSITVVALTLAATQLGRRLLRSFMRDRTNQLILGVFISTFLYCLLTLRRVGQSTDAADLPHITILGGFLLAIVAFGVLIYFIHHVARSIQAPNVITAVSQELNWVIDTQFPEEAGEEAGEEGDGAAEAAENELPEETGVVAAEWDAYLQAIDVSGLTELAREQNVVLKLLRRPGDFVAGGEALVLVYSAGDVEGALDQAASALRRSLAWAEMAGSVGRRREAAIAALRRPLIFGSRRTATQDVEFVMLQLVEIATRALSPGINDPFTAMTCIDRLSAAMCRLAGRRMPGRSRFDEDGNLRLILDQTGFEGLLNTAFRQICQSGRGNAAVIVRLLEALHRIAEQASRSEQYAAIWHHARIALRAGEELPEKLDRESIAQRIEALKKHLDSVAPAVLDED